MVSWAQKGIFQGVSFKWDFTTDPLSYTPRFHFMMIERYICKLFAKIIDMFLIPL